MSDKPQNKAKSTDRLEDKALDKPSINPELARESQTNAKGQQEIELKRTNKHDGSAGKSDQGDIESVRIESIDEHGNKKTVSRNDGGSEHDLLKARRPAGGFEEVHRADGGITLRGVIPGPGKELENITTGTMEAMASKNALVKNALEMRRQIDEHMEPGPERDKVVSQLKADVTASLMSGDVGESEIGGTHKAITDNTSINSEKPEKTEQDWQPIVEKVSQLPIDKQFEIIGTGLQSFNNEVERQKLEIATGTIEGIGEGFKSIGEGVVCLTNELGQIGQFSVDVMTNNPRALETGAQAGESIGKTLVGGVRLFQVSYDYLYNVGFTGEYAKPFNDIANLGNELNRRWQEMPTKERAKIAAKLSTETLVGMAVPLGANKLAKTEKVTELMEEFATAAKTLGKESKAVDAIEDTFNTLSRKGGHTIELREDELFSAKNPIHDRRHLSETEDLLKLVESFDLVVNNEGASEKFANKVKHYADALDPHEKYFLDKNRIKITTCRTMPEKFSDIEFGTAGLWVQKDNTIYIPEKVFVSELDNPAVEFHLRHEIGHAFNDRAHANEYEFSRTPSFIQSYKDAFDRVPPKDREIFKFTKDRSHWESLNDLQQARHNDPFYSYHETFADLYAHITGIGARTKYSESLESYFGNDCGDFVRQKIIDYIELMRQNK